MIASGDRQLHGYLLVLVAVPADPVSRGKDAKEVGVQVHDAAAGSTHAEQGCFAFQVDQPIGSLAVFRREYLKQVILDCLVGACDLGEAARATWGAHFVTFSFFSVCFRR
jgi:hypothetical protein